MPMTPEIHEVEAKRSNKVEKKKPPLCREEVPSLDEWTSAEPATVANLVFVWSLVLLPRGRSCFLRLFT